MPVPFNIFASETKPISTMPSAGTAMMGGGSDLDEAFRWLCRKGKAGEFLILRATGDDDYNPYVMKLCETELGGHFDSSRSPGRGRSGSRKDYPGG